MDNTFDILKEIDKRIKLRFLKEKRTSRTYIEGLEQFFTEDQIKDMVQKIKKKLSTSYFKRTDEDEDSDDENKKKTVTKQVKQKAIQIAHGFSGDHKERIIKILTEEYNIPREKIYSTS